MKTIWASFAKEVTLYKNVRLETHLVQVRQDVFITRVRHSLNERVAHGSREGIFRRMAIDDKCFHAASVSLASKPS